MGRSLLRTNSLAAPKVINPFAFHLELPWYRKLQIAVSTITIIPVKILLVSVCVALAWLSACVALAGLSEKRLREEPLSGWRRGVRFITQMMLRAAVLSCGIWIRMRGEQASRAEAIAFVCGPHSSFTDIICVVFFDDIPYGVSRAENQSIPLIGKIISMAQPIYVYREDRDSRQKTISELKRRAESNGLWSQFVIFPEGTTTNRQALITFKPGAFIPGLPVQPVLIRYLDEWDTLTWTWEGPGGLMLMWLTLSKLWTVMEVEFLPVYKPNVKEKQDPSLFAENVRDIMARALSIPVTDHTYEDCRLMQYAKKAKLRMGDSLVEFRKMQRKLGLDYDDIQKLLDKFCRMTNLCEGGAKVTIETFSKYMGLPITETLEELFSLYDRDGSGHIDFREYVIGMSLISEPAREDDTVRMAFKLFDRCNKGYVTEEEFIELLCNTLDTSEQEASALFAKVDRDGSGKVDFESFKEYAAIMPEYASIFTTYHKLKASNSQTQLDPESESLVHLTDAKLKSE